MVNLIIMCFIKDGMSLIKIENINNTHLQYNIHEHYSNTNQ